MRIISGIYKGRKLKSSTDLSIRPTTDRVKEYIFNILQDFPENKIVADIFSGSGNLGIEALSRGADKIVFVEKAFSSVQILKKNIEHLQIPPEKYQIVHKDALQFAKNDRIKADLVLMDPPFVYPPIQELLNTLFENDILYENGILVVEHEVSNPVDPENRFYSQLKHKKFGRSIIRFLEKKEKNES